PTSFKSALGPGDQVGKVILGPSRTAGRVHGGRTQVREELPDRLSIHVAVIRLVRVFEETLVTSCPASVGGDVLQCVGVEVTYLERRARDARESRRVVNQLAQHARPTF